MNRRLMMAQQASELPSGYTLLEYIKNSDTSYCQIKTTLLYKKPEDSVEIEFFLETDKMVMLLGSGSFPTGYLGIEFKNGKMNGYFSKQQNYNFSYNAPILTKHKLIVKENTILLNDSVVYNNSVASEKSTLNLYGWINTTQNPVTGVARIYSCKLTIDGIEHILMPVIRKADNVIGMFNTTTGEFYTNTANGTLIGGY